MNIELEFRCEIGWIKVQAHAGETIDFVPIRGYMLVYRRRDETFIIYAREDRDQRAMVDVGNSTQQTTRLMEGGDMARDYGYTKMQM